MSDIVHKNGDRENGKSRFEYVQTYSVKDESQSGTISGALDPQKILFSILHHKWLVLFLVLIGASSAWFYADSLTPQYSSSGTLLINTGVSSDDELSQIISQATGMRTSSTIINELQVIRSRDFASQIASTLISDDPGNYIQFPILWDIDEDEAISRAGESSVTSRVRNGLSVKQLEEDADVVEISFQSESPEEAAYIVNTAMDLYVVRSTNQNRRAAESTAEFLEGEMDTIRQRLQESEERLREYMDRTGIVVVNEQATGIVNEQVKLESELQQVNLELRTINESIESLENQLNRIRPGLSEEFSEAIGPRIQNFQEQLARYETERTLIISRNPGVLEREQLPSRIVFLDDQIANLKNEIRQLSAKLFTSDDEFTGMDTADRARLVSNIQSQLIELGIQQNQFQSRRDALIDRRQEIDSRFSSLPDGMVELSRLQRDVRINDELFVNVSRQYADMSVLKQSQFGFGRILDQAQVPDIPVSPNKIFMLILGIMMGGFAAVGYLVLKDVTDNSVNSIQLLSDIPLPLLSAVPVIGKKLNKKTKSFENNSQKIPNELVIVHSRNHIISESIRRLKNNLIYQSGNHPPKSLAVTSAEKGDGKTTVVANLGVAFAEEGYKTLIVDTDLRRSNLHKFFGLTNNEGLTDYLSGSLPLIRLFNNTDLAHLKVVTAGSRSMNPESVVNSKEFNKFREKVEDLFDVVIFDTPPFGIISDSTALLKSVESTILVSRFKKTNRGMFLKTVEELHRIDSNIAGIVLNAFDHKEEATTRYGSGYYQSLYSNYEAYVERD